MSAPKRLLEDPETASALRADLQAAASHQINFDMAAGLARFEATLATASAASATGLKAMLVKHLMLVKLGVAGVVVGGAVLGVGLFAANDPKPAASVVTPREPVTPVARVAPSSPAVPLATPSAPIETSPTQTAAQPVPAVPTPNLRRAPKAAPKPAAATAPPEDRDDLLQREVQQLRQIRQLVAANPAQALVLANQGHSSFRGGVLYQEREALALQALSALGRRSELQARGERYLRAFPNGSFSARVRQLLGR